MIRRLKLLSRNLILAFIYPKPLIGIIYLPRFIQNWIRFSKENNNASTSILDLQPCLGDWTTHTPFDAHYFYQAAWLSRKLAATYPTKHIDIGSDAKLISALSAFIPIEFLDYRPLEASLEGLECKKTDILSIDIPSSSVNSISCLHVVEHVGLGRYGDPINPNGSIEALSQLENVVANNGILYLTVPVGRERICFNAHRVFSPETILKNLPKMQLESFSLVDDAGNYCPNCDISAAINLEYGCGMFHMKKFM